MEATGLVFAASIMANQVGWTVGTVIAGAILAATGFEPNVEQTEHAKAGLKAMMSVIPFVAGFLTLGVFWWFYHLDEPVMERARRELEERPRWLVARLPAIAPHGSVWVAEGRPRALR